MANCATTGFRWVAVPNTEQDDKGRRVSSTGTVLGGATVITEPVAGNFDGTITTAFSSDLWHITGTRGIYIDGEFSFLEFSMDTTVLIGPNRGRNAW